MRACVFLLLLPAALVIGQIAPPAPPAAAIGPDTVIATVEGMNITVADFQKMAQLAPPQLTQAIKQGGATEVLRQLFVFKYLADEGDKNKLSDKSPLKEELETQRRWVVANAEVSHERDTYPVTDEMIQDFYNKNQAHWEQAKIKVIFVAFQPGSQSVKPEDLAAVTKQYLLQHGKAGRSEAEAMTIASDVVKQLRGGADFAALVEKYSEDPPSKQAGGDFGAITPASTYPDDFKKAILALEVGKVSDPLRQPNGFYIVKRVDKSIQPVKDVHEQIAQQIRSEHMNEEIQGLNKRFAPTILKPEFFAHPEAFSPPAAAAATAQH